MWSERIRQYILESGIQGFCFGKSIGFFFTVLEIIHRSFHPAYDTKDTADTSVVYQKLLQLLARKTT